MTASHASADLARAEKNLKKRSAAYTMGKSKRDDDLLTGPRPVTADVDFYDANVEAASTSKRSRSVIFSTAKRAGPFDVIAGSQATAMVTDDESQSNEGEDSDGGRRVGSTREAAPTLDGQRRAPAYSFGRAPRAPVSLTADAKAEAKDGGGGPVAVLDVTRAERYLRPNVAVALIRPSSAAEGGQQPATNEDDDEEEEEEEDDNNNNKDGGGGGGREREKMEVLSRHSRAPSTRIHPPSAPPQALITRDELFGPAGQGPGPGTYNIEQAKPGLAQAASSGTKGRVYRAPSAKNAAQLTLAAERKDGWVGGSAPGVGLYDVARAEKLVRKGSGGTAVVMRPPSSSAGPTPQQRRKKYWEDKASDARLDHDDLRETNFSQLLPHAPTVTMHKPTAMDWKSRMLLRQRQLEREEEEQRRVYSPKRQLVEPRSKAPAGMERQAASLAATKRRLDSKPGVAAVMLDKQEAERARDKFYGPQLQVPWGQGGGRDGGSDSGEESPTEEVSRLLTRSQGDTHTHARHGKRGLEGIADADTTTAYLRSSLAAPAVRASVVMRPAPDPSAQSRLALHESAPPVHEFIGPQLPVDWAAESEGRDQAHKNRAILFDAQTGRARVSVRQKGEVQVKEFDDWRVRPTESLGPGHYDADKIPAMGEDAKGAVAFSKFVSREEAIGPEGARPAAYEGGLEDVAAELAWLAPDRLDFDFGEARDRKQLKESSKRGLSLYGKERHPKPKQPSDPLDHRAAQAALSHVGGTWFEGMAATANKRPPVVDMGKMVGRSVTEAEAEEVMEGITGVQADGPTELDVKDWNPSLPRPAPAPAFKDAEKFPRFPADKPQPPGLADHLGGSHFQGMAEQLAKQPNAANMARQKGRGDADEEKEALKAVLGEGEVDIEAALSIAHARAAAIKAAEEKTNPKLKRPQFHADMSKQRGREDGEKGQGLGALDEGTNNDLAPPVLHKDFGDSTKGGAARWDKQAPRHAAEDEEATRRILRQEGLLGEDDRHPQRDRDVEAALRLLSAAEGEGEGGGEGGSGAGQGRAAKKGAKEKPTAQRSPRDSAANSRFKPSAPARSWNQDKRGRFDAADSKKATPDPGPALTPRGGHFVDPDAGALKGKGGAPLGKGPGSGSSSMKGKGSSLADELKEDKVMAEIMADLLGKPVEVVPLKKSSASASASASALASASSDLGEGAESADRGPGRVRFQPQQQPLSPLPAPSPSVPLPSAAPVLRGPRGVRAGAGAGAEEGAEGGEGTELTLSAAFEKLDAQLGQGQGQAKGK